MKKSALQFAITAHLESDAAFALGGLALAEEHRGEEARWAYSINSVLTTMG